MSKTHTPRGIAEKYAERLFSERFKKHMKSRNVDAFKSDYRTLYTQVIIPLIADEHLEYQRALYHEGEWERLMMELVGEDGTGSVRTAIEKMKSESAAYFDEVMKQRETIKELQEALRSARLFILRQGASTEAAEAYETVNRALIKSRNK